MLPNRLPRHLLRTLLAFLLTFASAPAFAQPVEASNLPANLRPLIPRGWVATSYAEVDMNKDGNMDRAVLLAPDSGDEPALGTIRGTPLRDRCRNLLLLVGLPTGRPPQPTYLPWSKQVAIKEWTDLSPAWAANCLDAPNPPEVPAEEHWASPLRMVDSISAVRNTLRYVVHTQTDDHWETLVIRVELDCLRLIGSEYEYAGGDDTNDSSSTSINYLTRKRIDESDTQLETLDRNGEYKREKRSATTTISQTAPICLNDRPILAPSIPPPAATPQTKVPIPVPPQAAAPPAPQATSQRRPTATADNPYLPPNPLLPRTECLTPPMPMLEHYNRRDSGFGEQLMGSCDGEYDVDVCTGVAHTMTFGDILRFSIGDAEYEDTIIWAVDDCGLWFRDANYIPDPPDGWAPQEARRGRYYVAPRQPDGSYLLDRWGNIGKGFRFTQLSGNFLKVRFER